MNAPGPEAEIGLLASRKRLAGISDGGPAPVQNDSVSD